MLPPESLSRNQLTEHITIRTIARLQTALAKSANRAYAISYNERHGAIVYGIKLAPNETNWS